MPTLTKNLIQPPTSDPVKAIVAWDASFGFLHNTGASRGKKLKT